MVGSSIHSHHAECSFSATASATRCPQQGLSITRKKLRVSRMRLIRIIWIDHGVGVFLLSGRDTVKSEMRLAIDVVVVLCCVCVVLFFVFEMLSLFVKQS